MMVGFPKVKSLCAKKKKNAFSSVSAQKEIG